MTTEIPVLSPTPAPTAPDDEDSTTVIKAVAWPPPAQSEVSTEHEVAADDEVADDDEAGDGTPGDELPGDEIADQDVPAEDERPEPDYRSEANALNIPPPEHTDETGAVEPPFDASAPMGREASDSQESSDPLDEASLEPRGDAVKRPNASETCMG
ncbi:hypothetical protein [Ornithinimicrobium sp. INDO-MA30-4]|uniref:hypothetical protein n=1 Tax=Ornithinimicrobium sp. INDO-MA30-4 TaxID=2908651 RepID=UPI001F3D85A1|nr:hypothetical protein [Ornithinimicrobium sp. INDO-MA30-4]UJH71536.1 hypothetical protein L0A91_07680 [Ornithinimicrobium sp. INDO-MA30-4]